jgi:hypothetical protein
MGWLAKPLTYKGERLYNMLNSAALAQKGSSRVERAQGVDV